jgi:excisionase family DNA binding protein
LERQRAARLIDKPLTSTQVAELIGVSTFTVWKWLDSGKLPHLPVGNGLVRGRGIRLADALAFKADRERRLAERATARANAISLTQRERRAVRLARGVCVDCGGQRSPAGSNKCERHRLMQQVRVRRYAERRRSVVDDVGKAPHNAGP